MTLLEKLDHAARLATEDWGRDDEDFWKGFSQNLLSLALVVKKTHVFLPGDLIIVGYNNGSGRRWDVYGRSSRGYDVSRYYMGFNKSRVMRTKWSEKHRDSISDYAYFTNRVAARFVDIPSEVRSATATDSGAIRRWLSTTQLAGDPVSAVGQGSGAFLPLEQDEVTPPRRKRSSTDGLRERRWSKKWRT